MSIRTIEKVVENKATLVNNGVNYIMKELDGAAYTILVCDKRKANFNIPYVAYANGMILKKVGNSNKIVCLPVPEFNPKSSLRVLELNQNQYTIYAAEDGTVVNLWYDEEVDHWRIATRKNLDVSELHWRGPLTYYEILTELLPENFWDNLDTKCCYSIGFKHPNFHAFQPEKKVWAIQKVNLTTLAVDTAWGPDAGLETQTVLTTSIADIKKAKNEQLKKYLAGEPAVYGWIIRSNNRDFTKRDSDIFIESDLFMRIRNLIYKQPRVERKFANNDAYGYMAVENLLNKHKKEDFAKLFDVSELQERLTATIEKVTKSADDYFNGSTTENEVPEKIFERIRRVLDMRFNINKETYKNCSDVTKRDIFNSPLFVEEYYDLLQSATEKC
ncbi:hypothetical protein BNJ_00122 [Kaumoebavirus]|uniref:hypothetical protein n=1 Tax=Kaumoebavirus TaxID=1859492 RepID=UPI0009C280AF|nr:hypothetical protein BNJ_00122 [Kaumoebavirus]ARA71955.1 hypothetical protein BNJ_00122 [Kaumoebavirus]